MMRRLAIALLALFLARHSYLPASEELLKERTISSERLLRWEKWVNPWKEMLDMRTSITDTHLILTCDAYQLSHERGLSSEPLEFRDQFRGV